MKCTKNYRLSYTDKAKEIVDKLSLEQKVHLMSGTVSLEVTMYSTESAITSRLGSE